MGSTSHPSERLRREDGEFKARLSYLHKEVEGIPETCHCHFLPAFEEKEDRENWGAEQCQGLQWVSLG